MAKRGAEDTLLFDSPTKRRYFRPLSSVDVRLESMASAGAVSPPPLLALLRSRCRKRPYFPEDDAKAKEATCFTRPQCESKKVSGDVLAETISGSYGSSAVRVPKRPRVDHVDPETVSSTADDKPVGDTHTEDCIYNSFQYWRVPLPELDLSLLETTNESKVNDSSFDAMET